jgi:hypothetical protein
MINIVHFFIIFVRGDLLIVTFYFFAELSLCSPPSGEAVGMGID